MGKLKAFLKRKDIILTPKRYGIDALGAMAQGLFCTLLVGTILNTLGKQFHIGFLNEIIVTMGKGEGAVGYTVGGLASAMVGPGIAIAIGFALNWPPLVLFSLIPVGFAANSMGGAGGPLAVYFVAIVASECGKLVSKETKIDILVTPIVTILVGVGVSALVAAPIGAAANAVGKAIMWATELQPFLMGIVVSVLVGVALTLPISSAAICASFGLVGLAGGAAVAGCCAQMIGFELRGEPLGRSGGPGAWYQHASNAQHREKSPDLDSPHAGFRHHRPSGHLPVQAGDERRAGEFGHGHLRIVRPDRHLDRLGERCGSRHQRGRHCHGLDRPGADLLRPAGGAEPGILRGAAKNRLDRGK